MKINNSEDALINNISFIIDSLPNKIYGCETEFQIELIILLRMLYPNYTIRAEYPYNGKRIDILIITDKGEWIPIELKYKKKECSILNNGLEVQLMGDGGQTDNVYNVLKDIERIERIKNQESSKFNKGYVIFLTNDRCYWERVYEPLVGINKNYYYSLLGNEIFIPETPFYRNKKLNILEHHSIKWFKFNVIDLSNMIDGKKDCNEFRYLVAEINKND